MALYVFISLCTRKKSVLLLIADVCTIGTCEIEIPHNGNVFIMYLIKSYVSSLDNIFIDIKDNSLEN